MRQMIATAALCVACIGGLMSAWERGALGAGIGSAIGLGFSIASFLSAFT